MLGCWQQQVGAGTLLRHAADASACAAHSGARVKVEGGQQCLLCMAHVAGGAGQSWRGGSGTASLAAHGLLLLTMAGCLG
jgi:hypothetical protein